MIDTIEVRYKDQPVGALSYTKGDTAARFEYLSEFVDKNIPLAPLTMPAEKGRIYAFPGLNWDTFRGLPGMLADSLPDDFGNAVLNQWVAQQPDRTEPLSPLERLQYTGERGMGALEYHPARTKQTLSKNKDIELESLMRLAQDVLDARKGFRKRTHFDEAEDREMMQALLAVGTSAGGARPKAVLAFNDDFSQVRSGQGTVPEGFEHYLLKFDGVRERDPSQQTFGDPLGYGAMEYVYYLMATQAGIHMMPCHLLEEGSRRHFVTKRFDRVGNEKKHIQTLTAIKHVNYHDIGSFSYEELFQVARQLRLPREDAMDLFRRMVFNHVATNHDDHSKNFGFMLEGTQWRLSPAYDVAFSYKPGNPWVEQHWMSLNGKRSDHSRADFYALSDVHLPKVPRQEIDAIIDDVIESVAQWPQLAKAHDVPKTLADSISSHLKLKDFS
ncbi:type II toxin-antitoxin system HipA family toxin [Idiomarina sp. HP20-50]|uniref:type II toxin-antitoxin system HipA family toxin n=1 Tax=Idiomarina sp. HP20-50 TaxID=3070813 RepID=UPI00294B331B|nr:type II toxin-antitoxin system HipA family toxin [Idiomarina sp. HP20-50]MDV6315735.1 type II toxin-antitoxin system HipA family toxin [Idiomarina sp. HP20-50]